MSFPVSFYLSFPVEETLDIKDSSSIQGAVNKMIQCYQSKKSDEFSFRILLPRDEKNTSHARKLGFALQSELLLELKKKNIKTNLKEFRYIHDSRHYGWLIVNPDKYNKLTDILKDKKD